MIVMSLKEAAALLNCLAGEIDCSFHGVSIDSRTLMPGQLFFAIKGEQFDGHQYAKQAHERGAVAIVASDKIETSLPVLYVDDTVQALGILAHAWRVRFHATVLALTGSSGKTTTKTMLYEILLAASEDPENAVLCSQASFNNNIGVPLTLFHLTPAHRYVVLEMGMNHAGELTQLSQMAKPDVAAVLNIGPAHIGLLGNLENIALAKSEIFSGLTESGFVVLNADDPFYPDLVKRAIPHNVLTFGVNPTADVMGSLIDNHLHPKFMLHYKNESIPVQLNIPGKHNVYNALAAACIALSQGITLTAIQQGLQSMRAVSGRLQTQLGFNGAQLIDDTYNANPASVLAGVNVLAAYEGKKILVLGDMGELGEMSEYFHREVGEHIKNLPIDHCFLLGEQMKVTAEVIGHQAKHFSDLQLLIDNLKVQIDATTTVLIKGSRFMRMEKILTALMVTDKVSA